MEYSSNAKGNLAVTLGSIATGLSVLNSNNNGNGILSGILGNNGNSEDKYVNRYEAAQNATIARLETEVKLRDANTFTMGELSKLREYVDNRFSVVEGQICQQAVLNATTNSTLTCLAGQIAQLQNLTKMVIPAANICPAPTTTTTGA